MAEKLSIEEVGKYKVNTVLLGGIINIGDQASVIYGNMLDNKKKKGNLNNLKGSDISEPFS